MGTKMVEKASSSRLYVRDLFLGYKRSKANQHTNMALLKLEHVECTKDATWYLGKRVAYVYKAKTEKQGGKFRCIWGKVVRPHGTSGVVRAKFQKNLPPAAMGGKVRVILYPSSI